MAVCQIKKNTEKSTYVRQTDEVKEDGGVNMCKAFERSMEEAIRTGERKGQQETAGLLNFLLTNGRNDDAIRATSDEEYLSQLLKDFNNGVLTAN